MGSNGFLGSFLFGRSDTCPLHRLSRFATSRASFISSFWSGYRPLNPKYQITIRNYPCSCFEAARLSAFLAMFDAAGAFNQRSDGLFPANGLHGLADL